MPIRKIRSFLRILLVFFAFFLILIGSLLFFLSANKNCSESHIFKSIAHKSFVDRINVTVADLDGNGDDEIIFVSRNRKSKQFHQDQLSFYDDLFSTPTIRDLSGKCLDFTVADIFPERPGKEILLLEIRNGQLFFEILGFSGQFIARIPISSSDFMEFPPGFAHILSVSDWNGDGKPDLCVALRRSVAPFFGMGIYVFSISKAETKTIWHYPIEAKASVREFALPQTVAGRKGHLFYVLNFDKRTSTVFFVRQDGQIAWERQLQKDAGYLHICDFDPQNPGPEILLSSFPRGFVGAPANSLLELRLSDGKILRSQIFTNRITDFVCTKLKNRPTLFLLTTQGFAFCLNTQFKIVRKLKIEKGFWKAIVPVRLGDRKTLHYLLQSNVKIVLLSHTFKQISRFSQRIFRLPLIYHRSPNSDPIFVLGIQSRDVDFVSLQFNHYYYLLRSFFVTLGGFLLLIFLGFMLTIVPEKKEHWENLIGKFLLQESKMPTLIFSADRQLAKFNREAEKLLRLNLEKVQGAPCQKVFSNGLAALAAMCNEVFSGGFESRSAVLRVKVEGEEIQMKVDMEFIYQPEQESQRILLVFLQDVSPLTRAEKLEAWVSMAQRIAHDVKTPLSTVNLTAQRMALEMEAQQEQKFKQFRPYIEQIQEEVERIRKITNNFLKFARLEKLNRIPLDVNKVAREVLFDFEQRLPAPVQLIEELDSAIPPVLADEEQIRTVLENILDNAIQAIEGEGRITFRTESVEEWDPLLHGPRQFVSLEISDTGRGIPEDLLDLIVKPFFTAKKGGTGLGLAIVRESVKAHGGKLKIQSKENIGTQVTVLLPAVKSEQK